MNKATVTRWLECVALYILLGVGAYFLMKSEYIRIGITPPGYQDITWWLALQGILINTTIASFALLLFWNFIYSFKLLGGRAKGGGVYVRLLLFCIIYIIAGIGAIFNAVLPILRTVAGNPLPLFYRLLTEWSIAYGGDFILLHLLPLIFMFIPLLFGITLFGPECIAHKFLFNSLRPKIHIRYNNL